MRRTDATTTLIRRPIVRLLSVACFVTALAIQAAILQAATLGPGDVAGGNTSNLVLDTGSPYLAVDQTNPVFLAPGTYSADFFNHQFATASGATVIPAVEISNGSGSYHTIAVGSALTDSAAEGSFTSTVFGGSNLFTVGAGGQTVYAAVYQSGTAGLSPVGFLDNQGSAFILYNNSNDPNNHTTGANPPTVGTDISGTGGSIALSRTYDFSITVNAVPEPSSLLLLSAGALGLMAFGLRRRTAR